MRYGCCLNMIAEEPDGTGIEFIGQLKTAGYDYVELPLAEMAALSEEAFENIQEKLIETGISCEVCNNFFPKTIRLTGENVKLDAVMEYVEKALHRAEKLGVSYVVFGSGPAKNVPDGFPLEEGYRQVVDLLKRVNTEAAKRNITVVIEPLRKAECNLINTFEEGCRLARDVDGDHVKVLVDFYHLTVEKEPAEHVAREGETYLRHVHFARPEGRKYPGDISEAAYPEFAEALKAARYNRRISCEAYTENYLQDAEAALTFFKQLFPETD